MDMLAPPTLKQQLITAQLVAQREISHAEGKMASFDHAGLARVPETAPDWEGAV